MPSFSIEQIVSKAQILCLWCNCAEGLRIYTHILKLDEVVHSDPHCNCNAHDVMSDIEGGAAEFMEDLPSDEELEGFTVALIKGLMIERAAELRGGTSMAQAMEGVNGIYPAAGDVMEDEEDHEDSEGERTMRKTKKNLMMTRSGLRMSQNQSKIAITLYGQLTVESTPFKSPPYKW